MLAEKDETALKELMALYSDELLRTAYLLVKDRQVAEEAVMDSFLQAYNKIHQLKEPDKLRGWLLRIVVNRCRMRMRTWNWRRLLPFAEVEMEETERSPEDLLLTEWRNEQLSAAIHRLDYRYREVITLYYYNGFSVLEIAEHVKSNENTVKARLSRGRTKLKQMLQEGDGDENEARAGAGVY
ncbi:sigma-70 family RNA polymerase sigma factor [Cohnella mopanensis]|uniref:sigma-70 family RNA polymerase sigma factor n=1 Tax=Cohnella mopanensis TaxID=2911966 RepID=UPI001EF86C89|nr:sigma-70 family RNA polymerase sigma factor [Cohnella mopanensis]